MGVIEKKVYTYKCDICNTEYDSDKIYEPRDNRFKFDFSGDPCTYTVDININIPIMHNVEKVCCKACAISILKKELDILT